LAREQQKRSFKRIEPSRTKENKMMSYYAQRTARQKRVAKIHLVGLGVALLLALVALPASADNDIDADSARWTAMGEYYTAKTLEASDAAFAARYQAMAAYYDQAGGVVIAQDAEQLVRNPELKSVSYWGGASAGAAASADDGQNPELSSFRNYCGC
jgi:hypothetical protein